MIPVSFSLFLYFSLFLSLLFYVIIYFYKNYFIIIIILFIYFFLKVILFFHVPGCSSMFRNVPCSRFYRHPHQINKFANYQNIIVKNSVFVSSQDRCSMDFDVMRMIST